MAPKSNIPSKKTKFSIISSKRDQLFAVDVGPQSGRFYVHKAVLIQHSDYFRKALQGPWKEAAEGLVTLKDVKPAIFHAFVDWLYTGDIPKMNWEDESDEEDAGDDENDKQLGTQEYEDSIHDEDCWCDESRACCGANWYEEYVTTLVQAYTFGERILAPNYKHAVLDRLIEEMFEYIEPTWFHAIAHAYDNLPEGDPMLGALENIHCRYWTPGMGALLSKEKKDQAKLVPAIFWLCTSDILENALNEFPRAPWNHTLDPCDYHGHSEASKDARKKCKEQRDIGCHDYGAGISYPGPRFTIGAS